MVLTASVFAMGLALASQRSPDAGPAKEPADGPAMAASEAELAAIRIALDDQIADAESARLKGFMVRHGSDRGGHACGKINAKNRFGAYVGYQLLYADIFDWKDQGIKAIVWSPEPRLASTMCSKHKLVPSD